MTGSPMRQRQFRPARAGRAPRLGGQAYVLLIDAYSDPKQSANRIHAHGWMSNGMAPSVAQPEVGELCP
jgi:hypothetical protein